jgi:hypothetical protein
MREGPQSVDELAKATTADKSALRRLLVALSTVGICSPAGKDRYSLTAMGTRLDSAAEHSFKSWAILEGQMLSQSWNGMLESIMTGKTAAQLMGVSDVFELMARIPENVGIFNAAMTELTRLVTPAVLGAYDFGAISHLMDVGGRIGRTDRRRRKAIPAHPRDRFRSSQMRRRRE